MIYFTSDWHLGEKRLGNITLGGFNPFFRPFKTTAEQDQAIIQNLNEEVGEKDTLYHLGDVLMTEGSFRWLEQIKCDNKILILGNHDLEFKDKLGNYFDIKEEGFFNTDKSKFYLNHYPSRSISGRFNIVGHIHGLWKVKRNMVNVSVDAWNFLPVSLPEILFVKNAIDKGFYDENVFWGEKKNPYNMSF